MAMGRGWIETFQQAIFLLNWIDDLPAFTNVSKPFVDDPVLERQSSCMKKSTAALAQQRMVFMVMSLLRNEGI